MTEFEVTCKVEKGERNIAYGEDCYCYYTQPNYNERIVRCRDCKYSQLVFNTFTGFVERQCFGYLVTTWDYENDKPLNNLVSDNSFCSWGEMSE